MKYIITIDAGTTNTRAVLFDQDRNMKGMKKREIGVRNTAIDGNNAKLKAAVKECIDELLADEGIGFDDVMMILASGMITSNVGLVEIPHLIAPAGINELAAGVTPVVLEDVCPLPIHFIPGIKNTGAAITLENYEKMDIMRGEEAESMAMIDGLPKGKPILLVLPGSHTKFVAIDDTGRITGCLTSITGELLSVITNNTIIADAVGHHFVEEGTYDKELLLTGYENAKRTGLGRACFSCRILNQFSIPEKERLANYILGAVLQSDVAAIKNSDAVRATSDTLMIVAGKNPLRQAICDILEHDGSFGEVINYQPQTDIPLSSLGAFLIAHKGGLL